MAARARPGRDLYQRGSLRFLPGQETVPLLVDHDDDREIGIVHELVRRQAQRTPVNWLFAGIFHHAMRATPLAFAFSPRVGRRRDQAASRPGRLRDLCPRR